MMRRVISSIWEVEEEKFKNGQEYIIGGQAERFNFATLEFQSLEGIIKAIGIDRSKLCTYCWSGNKADFGSSYKANPAITNPEQPAQSENPTQPANPEQSSQKENSGVAPCLKQNSQPNPNLKN